MVAIVTAIADASTMPMSNGYDAACGEGLAGDCG